jgi:hypothetical protein
LNETLYFKPKWLPFYVRSETKGFAQLVYDGLDELGLSKLLLPVPIIGNTNTQKLEALAEWDLTLAQNFDVHPKTRIIPSTTFFARALTHRRQNTATNDIQRNIDNEFQRNIDQDVYSPYKYDHTAGFIPALTVVHQPWLDTIWTGKIAEGTNENFDITRPDHYSTEVHWKQLLGSLVVELSYSKTFYQADDYGHQYDPKNLGFQPNSPNRIHAIPRSFAGLELNWQKWTVDQNRFEVGAQYTYDIQRHAHLAMLSFTLHFGQGRGYRDFAPGEIDFRDIRQRTDIHEQNNTIQDLAN